MTVMWRVASLDAAHTAPRLRLEAAHTTALVGVDRLDPEIFRIQVVVVLGVRRDRLAAACSTSAAVFCGMNRVSAMRVHHPLAAHRVDDQPRLPRGDADAS